MGTVRMSDLLEQARSFDPSKVESRTTTWAPLEEGFASDAQRRAAFASGYKEKGKKKKDEEVEVVNELTAAEKKLINMMYDKKGNLTPLGKKVMDHGKSYNHSTITLFYFFYKFSKKAYLLPELHLLLLFHIQTSNNHIVQYT